MIKKGLDLSSWQNGIDFKNIKNCNVDFLILRGSFTSTKKKSTEKFKDSSFEYFYKQAKKYQIPVGAYHYSTATSYEEGVKEAEYLYRNCLAGKQFEYPIFIDVEDKKQNGNVIGVTDGIIAFCDTLEKLGFYVSIYANVDYFKNKMQLQRLTVYDKWLAYWTNTLNIPEVKGINFGIWQYSNDCFVGGKRVDGNLALKDYEVIIKNKNLNGFYKKSNELIAQEVIKGYWGNGKERKEKLLNAGYDYLNIQYLVNKKLKGV